MINYQDFDYNGSKITFSKGKNVYVCATQMAKPFGKNPSDWLRNQTAQEYISAVADETQIPVSELVITRKGGGYIQTSQGTWMHKDVAMEFARWLAPKFGIWCNRRIEELLTNGKVELNPNVPVPLTPATLTPEQEAKIRYADACIESDVPTSFKGIAGRIMLTNGKKMTRPQLMAWLFNNGYLQKDENILYCPTQWAIDMGYFMIKIGRRQIRTDRAPRNGRDKGVPTPKGAMHIIDVLSHSLPDVSRSKGMINM